MYDIKDYQYELPSELIAQKPLPQRDSSRLMVVERGSGHRTHCRFKDLAGWLREGDLLVLNNTAVVPARLIGTKETGGKVEVLLIDYPDRATPNTDSTAIVLDCLVKAAKRPKPGSKLNFDHRLQGTVLAELDGRQRIAFSGPDDFESLLERTGRVPLPPYIRNGIDDEQDRVNYQTVYASIKGAVAAPTAGLHFTDALLDQLRRIGVDIVALTLHVGYGTFAPVRVQDIRQHRMHAEPVTIPVSTADAVNAARDEGRRVIAVGTTSVRSLEFAAAGTGRIQPGQHHCDLFIYPGYRFKAVDGMITNFHLPGSTLLMLVSAFTGREQILSAYAGAIRRRYRFYSYGDAMLIL
jgi:S-adenosylmethionine:tRNA ribosyltransferase-isomerase